MTYCGKRFAIIIVFFIADSVYGYGLPGVNLGFTNILDGGPVRPKPGPYWLQYAQYYTTHRFLDCAGKPLFGDVCAPRLRDLTTITQFVYQFALETPRKGMPGVSVDVPLTLYSKIGKNPLNIQSSGSGFGNLGFGMFMQWSAIMHKERPLFIHRLSFNFSIPFGKNKLPCKQINPSETFFSCGPHWSGTFYFSQQWAFSWRLHYLWSAKNEKIDFQAGDVVYCNYSLEYEPLPKWWIAAVGYVLKQVHDHKALGVPVPHSKERVFGVGPGTAYFVSKDFVVFGYLYLEGGVRNRPQGTSFIARLVMHF